MRPSIRLSDNPSSAHYQGVQGKAGGDQKLRENIDSSEVIDLRVEFFSLGWGFRLLWQLLV